MEAVLQGVDGVEVIYKSYELSPGAVAGSKDSVYEAMAKKQNCSIMDAMEYYRQLEKAAEKVGLKVDSGMITPTNTFDALRLTHLAKNFGLQAPLVKRLFEAHFAEGVDVADHGELVRIATEVGMDEGAARQLLESSDYREEVIGDHAAAALMGITSVPYYVIDEKYGMGGAQTVEAWEDILKGKFA